VIFCCSPTGVLRAGYYFVGGGLARVSTASPRVVVSEVDDLDVLGDTALGAGIELGLFEGSKVDTARCGSTLVVQVVSGHDDEIVFASEADLRGSVVGLEFRQRPMLADVCFEQTGFVTITSRDDLHGDCALGSDCDESIDFCHAFLLLHLAEYVYQNTLSLSTVLTNYLLSAILAFHSLLKGFTLHRLESSCSIVVVAQ